MRNTWLIGLMVLALVSCKKDPEPEGTLEIELVTTVNGQPFQDQVVFTNVSGRQYYFDVVKLLLSNITLVEANGNTQLAVSDVLFDIGGNKIYTSESDPTTLVARVQAPAGSYTGVRFGIGAPADRNNGNPASYPSSHPLHIDQKMNWSWATGYRFLIAEGRIDSSANKNGDVDLGFAYHTGLNELYREIQWNGSTDGIELPVDGTARLRIQLDLGKLFYQPGDTLDMVKHNLTHTTPLGSEQYSLAEKVSNNLVQSALTRIK